MTQEGIVTKALNNGLAEVMVERTTACGECANREVCHYTSEVRTFAKNSIGAREGEKVIIQSKSSEIIGAAFLLYIVPLAVLLIGYLLIAQTGAPESTCIAGAFTAFAVAVAVVTIYQRQRTKKKQIEFEIIAYNLNE